MTRDTDLYGRILGIESSWEVTGVEMRLEAGDVEVFVARGSGESYRCPECGGSASRHEYVRVVADIKGEARVHHVADGRGKEALSSYYESLSDAERSKIETVAMERWAAYMSATVLGLANRDQKLAFDRFRVAHALTLRCG